MVAARRIDVAYGQKKPSPAVARWHRKFLVAFRKTKSLNAAAKAIKKNRNTVYYSRQRYPEFDQAILEADESFTDELEACALERAINGWLEPVFYKGEQVGTVRKFSNALTIFMLKCRRRERYLVEHTEEQETTEQKAAEIRRALKEIELVGAPPRVEGYYTKKAKRKVDAT